MSSDVVSRLLEAIEEREKLAESASPGPWKANAEHDEVWAVDDIEVATGFALSNNQLRNTVDHIVANDPKSVLRLCQAHRELIDEWRKQAQIRDQLDEPSEKQSDAYLTAVGIVAGLWAAVTLVARGYGVEDQ